MHDWQSYILSQIARDVSEIRAKLDDLLTWAQRLALLAMLWGAGLLTNMSAEKTAEILAALVKSAR